MAAYAVELLRGGLVESRVRADVAVVDSLGHIRYWFGDPDYRTFWRSSAKPFQALPLLEAGGQAAFHLTPEEIAIICASHGGEAQHLALVTDLLERLGASPDELICGIHPPSHRDTAWELIRQHQAPTVLHNNCSGKHTGMLMLATLLNAPRSGYHLPDHPVQQHIRQAVLTMTRMRPDDLATGIDGCGVPTFYLPLSRMALAYARLVDPRGLDVGTAGAAWMIAEAMRHHPELVSGTGRLEVTLAEATDYRFVAKGGAEAVFCLGIPERGLGIAVKLEDGNSRVMGPVVAEILRQLDELTPEMEEKLADVLHPVITNHSGTVVGAIRPVLTLHAGRL
ncbi:L-asparaginase II [Sulfobacillus acidophilus TPY]|uniref:Asparaginase n=1 Tax=Sulfobacillus acidophilus (strain ATCC 700253 / DSM 10332 / NAL) TaxID=679936 RepID=G8TXW4_SULAD|nr:L-asparaginase II [Sulfobacillus acidophilus TPY]AEW06170.1 asparaginase [Sulfobacillus acidophilus DSM 10332]